MGNEGSKVMGSKEVWKGERYGGKSGKEGGRKRAGKVCGVGR